MRLMPIHRIAGGQRCRRQQRSATSDAVELPCRIADVHIALDLGSHVAAIVPRALPYKAIQQGALATARDQVIFVTQPCYPLTVVHLIAFDHAIQDQHGVEHWARKAFC